MGHSLQKNFNFRFYHALQLAGGILSVFILSGCAVKSPQPKDESKTVIFENAASAAHVDYLPLAVRSEPIHVTTTATAGGSIATLRQVRTNGNFDEAQGGLSTWQLPLPGGISTSEAELNAWMRALEHDESRSSQTVIKTPAAISTATPVKTSSATQANTVSSDGLKPKVPTEALVFNIPARARLASPNVQSSEGSQANEKIPFWHALTVIILGTIATLGVIWLAVEILSRRWKL